MDLVSNPTPWLRFPPGQGAGGKPESALNYEAFQQYYLLTPASAAWRRLLAN